MQFSIEHLSSTSFPYLLHEIPEPPTQLNYRGSLPTRDIALLTIVGSRRYTTYAKQVIDYLLDGLHGYPVGVVSGLALGVDSLAHEAALRNHLYTMAVPGSGIDDAVIYPARHRGLATRILESGGALLSEFDPDFKATKWSFAQRNRIMAGIAQATLIIEAAPQSGTLITARLTTDYDRDLLVVPGNIFSQNSQGAHQFLKLGATPVTHADDILDMLGISHEIELAKTAEATELTPDETAIIELLANPTDRDTLIRESGLDPATANTVLMHMEMEGLIQSEQSQYRRNL